jgi:(2Fe-2S) ferredoxin
MAVKDLINTKKCLFICNGGCCMKKDAEEITLAIRKCIKEMGLDDDYHTVRTKCIGRCDDAPVAMLSPDNIWLQQIDAENCKLIIEQIEKQKISESDYFLYKMGENSINSNSIPTKYKTKKVQI